MNEFLMLNVPYVIKYIFFVHNYVERMLESIIFK